MPLTIAQPNIWTTIPDQGGDTLIDAVDKGLYVDTTGALTTDERAKGHPLPGGDSMVIQASVASGSLRVMPANSVKAASVRYQKV
jgi:hypothetical protein